MAYPHSGDDGAMALGKGGDLGSLHPNQASHLGMGRWLHRHARTGSQCLNRNAVAFNLTPSKPLLWHTTWKLLILLCEKTEKRPLSLLLMHKSIKQVAIAVRAIIALHTGFGASVCKSNPRHVFLSGRCRFVDGGHEALSSCDIFLLCTCVGKLHLQPAFVRIILSVLLFQRERV